MKIGELFQIQDDFLDCYGAPEVTGKVGTDIRDGKLTWLIAKALQVASKSQIENLQEHYGQTTASAEYEVKCIYDDLGIEELFYKYEDSTRQEILNMIRKIPRGIPQEPFLNALDAMYRREK
jgi:farnesyl diphosphate synthase